MFVRLYKNKSKIRLYKNKNKNKKTYVYYIYNLRTSLIFKFFEIFKNGINVNFI